MSIVRHLVALVPLALSACAGSPSPSSTTVKTADVTVATGGAQRVPAAAPAARVLDPQAELAKKFDPIFSSFAQEGAMSPGCAVGIYRAGEIVFSKGYGYADLEHEAPITDTTPFYVASMSKQFTAAAVQPEKLAEYTGRYGSDELAHDVEIRLEGSHLVAGPVGGAARSAPFRPLARDLFDTDDESQRFSDEAGWRFERNARGKIVRLVVSTDRAWNVVLVRR